MERTHRPQKMTKFADENIVLQESGCAVCGKVELHGSSSGERIAFSEWRLRRCSRCRGPERYCSVECQRQDWNRGHKKLCRKRQDQRRKTAESSWQELQKLVMSSSMQDANHDFHTAKDYVKGLEEEKSNLRKEKVIKANNPIVDMPQQNTAQPNPIDKLTMPPNYNERTVSEPSAFEEWKVYITDLTKLSCFQISIQSKLLRKDKLSLHNVENYNVKILESSRRESRIGLFVEMSNVQQLLICFDLPSPIEKANLIQLRASEPGNTIVWSIRATRSFKSEGNRITNHTGSESFTVDLNRLYCRGCHDKDSASCTEVYTPLFLECPQTNDDIDETELYRLPTGHWQDMVEYLSCSGQEDLLWPQEPQRLTQSERLDTVGFNEGYISTAQKRMNPQAACSIMPDIPKVETDEDLSTWKPSLLASSMSVQNQLMCTRCWSQLGWCVENDSDPGSATDNGRIYDPSSGIYLMRSMISPSSKASTSTAGFWANEMIHLAETQGIFTILLSPDARSSKGSPRVLWLRLWQWDSSLGSSGESCLPGPHIPIHWSSIAKVIFQCGYRSDFVSSVGQEFTSIGFADVCCPPFSKDKEVALGASLFNSSARIISTFLPSWQLSCLQNELQHEFNLLDEVMDPSANEATIKTLLRVQTGVNLSGDDRIVSREAGIALVPL